MPMRRPLVQQGVSLIAAVFAVMGLSLLGLIAVQLMVTTSQNQIASWNAEQALYAAESGVDWAAHQINQSGSCDLTTNDRPLQTGAGIEAWFDVSSESVTIDGGNVCSVTVTGKAGGTSSSPEAQRELEILYAPAVVR